MNTKKILVVEDDKFLNNAYKVKFTKAGFEVQVATDGNEAIKIMGEFTPDVVLLDLIMPIKDGFATLEEMRANPAWKNIPIVIASNLGQQEDIKRGMSLGATDFVIKSDMSIEELLKKIMSMVDKAGAATAPSAPETAAPAQATPTPAAPSAPAPAPSGATTATPEPAQAAPAQPQPPVPTAPPAATPPAQKAA